MKRFFLKVELGTNITLQGSEHNHLANVLRLKVYDEIIICNGDEFDYLYKISNISKSQSNLSFSERKQNTHNPRTNLVVFLAYIKHENLSLVTEKLCELGVSRLCLFSSERSNIAKSSIKLEKLQTIAEQSCKQCGRSMPLKVEFGDINEVSKFDEVIFCDETERARSLGSVTFDEGAKIAIVVGAEGGFTPKEREKVRELGGRSVSLGARVLRAETAAIVASAIVLSKLGEI